MSCGAGHYLEYGKPLVYLIPLTPSDAIDYQLIIRGLNFRPVTCYNCSFQSIEMAHQALDQSFQ